jgi:hypothetical protein
MIEDDYTLLYRDYDEILKTKAEKKRAQRRKKKKDGLPLITPAR